MLRESLIAAGSARRRLHERRRAAERIVGLAAFLDPADRLLVEQVFRHGLTVADVARLARRPAYHVRRRLARLLRRLRRPEFAFLAGHADLFPRPQRRSVEMVVFHGQSLRRVAAQTGLTLHRVRQHLASFKALGRL